MDLSSLALLKSHLRESSFLRNLTFSHKFSVSLAKASFLFNLLLHSPFAFANVSFSESELEEIRADIQFIQSRPKIVLFEQKRRQPFEEPVSFMPFSLGCVVCSQSSSNEKDYKKCLESQGRDRFCSWDKIKDQFLSKEGMNAYQINSHLEYDLYHRNNLDCAFCLENEQLGLDTAVEEYFLGAQNTCITYFQTSNKDLVRVGICYAFFLKNYKKTNSEIDEFIENFL